MERVEQHRNCDNSLSEKGIVPDRKKCQIIIESRGAHNDDTFTQGPRLQGMIAAFISVTTGRRISKAAGFFEKFD